MPVRPLAVAEFESAEASREAERRRLQSEQAGLGGALGMLPTALPALERLGSPAGMTRAEVGGANARLAAGAQKYGAELAGNAAKVRQAAIETGGRNTVADIQATAKLLSEVASQQGADDRAAIEAMRFASGYETDLATAKLRLRGDLARAGATRSAAAARAYGADQDLNGLIYKDRQTRMAQVQKENAAYTAFLQKAVGTGEAVVKRQEREAPDPYTGKVVRLNSITYEPAKAGPSADAVRDANAALTRNESLLRTMQGEHSAHQEFLMGGRTAPLEFSFTNAMYRTRLAQAEPYATVADAEKVEGEAVRTLLGAAGSQTPAPFYANPLQQAPSQGGGRFRDLALAKLSGVEVPLMRAAYAESGTWSSDAAMLAQMEKDQADAREGRPPSETYKAAAKLWVPALGRVYAEAGRTDPTILQALEAIHAGESGAPEGQ